MTTTDTICIKPWQTGYQNHYQKEQIIMRGNKIMGFVWIILAACLLSILIYKMNFSSHAGPRGRFKMGGENNLLFSTNDGNGPIFLPGSYDLVESKQFDVSEIDSFDFDITRETLWIQQVDERKYTVELYCPDEWKPSVKAVNRTLQIESKQGFNLVNAKEWKIIVKVPKNEELDNIDIAHSSGSNHLEGIKFKTIDLNCTSGSTHLSNCSGKKVEINTSSGSVHIKDSSYDELDITASSGSIHIDDSDAKKLSVDTSSGSSKIRGKFNQFDLHAISGSIRMDDEISPDGDCELRAVSGSIYLNLPKHSGFNAKYELGSGHFHNHITGLDGKKGSETVNGGGPKILLKANSGSVHINSN
ncbi:MAG: DUF4097 family beta strand repeat protein [Treponema sp.]|nr:DUF4097 family beta strand repeat protein [Treponema sp.]